MAHFLIVTHTDAKLAGLRGNDFNGRSVLAHCRNLDYALAYMATSTREGVSVIAAYDVTDAYNTNDIAGMFPATVDDMTSPSLVNLLDDDTDAQLATDMHTTCEHGYSVYWCTENGHPSTDDDADDNFEREYFAARLAGDI